MLTELLPNYAVNMLAVIKQRNEATDSNTDNTGKYLLLLLVKWGLDIVVFYLCCRKPYTSFMSMCSLTITIADSVMAFLMATTWYLGPESYFVPPCFLLAYGSAAYGALPLPVMCFGLLDYCLEDNFLGKRRISCKLFRNVVLILLVWTFAVIYSYVSANPELMELDYMTGITAQVCEVEESILVTYFVLMLFSALIFTMLPFWSRVPHWKKEADKISEAREEQEIKRSDLFTAVPGMEAETVKNCQEETVQPSPPLWFSLTLGFSLLWMPYLLVSVLCFVFFCGVPAYISINLLWLECTNSLLVGMVFWVKSSKAGPYSHLPDNVCLWHVYWHLSKGTQQMLLPIAVFNPSKAKRNTLLYV